MANLNLTNTDVLIMDKMLRMQLTNIRKSKHLTQKQLSELSGLSESCISNIESGSDSSPTLFLKIFMLIWLAIVVRKMQNNTCIWTNM